MRTWSAHTVENHCHVDASITFATEYINIYVFSKYCYSESPHKDQTCEFKFPNVYDDVNSQAKRSKRRIHDECDNMKTVCGLGAEHATRRHTHIIESMKSFICLSNKVSRCFQLSVYIRRMCTVVIHAHLYAGRIGKRTHTRIPFLHNSSL